MGKSSPASGDIRDLYAHYRFSDHEATSISLKNKKLSSQEIYFEGHMDWSFKECIFDQSIHFGYEGPRLAEDDRDTPENQEPFPEYGSNALNFSKCEVTKPIRITDNCVAIFKECLFKSGCFTISVSDSCRVEFIDCIFEKCDITISAFCTFKFTGCTHGACEATYIVATKSSTGAVHAGSFSEFAPDYVVHADDNSEVVVTDSRSDLNSNHDCMFASNSSTLKVFGGNKLQGKPAVSAKLGSKIEVRDFKGITSGGLQGVRAEDGSEVYCSLIGAIHSGGSNAVKLDTGSKARFNNVQVITSPVDVALLLDNNSELSIDMVKEISSVDSKCLEATDSTVTINNVKMAFTVNDDVMYLNNSVGYFRDFQLMAMTNGTAVVHSTNKSSVYMSDIDVISTTTGDAVKADDAFVEDLRGKARVGEASGYHSMNDGVITTRLIEDVTTTTGPGVLIEDASVDIRTMTSLSGKTFGIEGTDARGVIKDNTKVVGTESAGISINGTSGPLSIFGNTLVTSAAEEAFVFSGYHDKTQVGNITEATSLTTAIDISGYTGGTLLFKDMTLINAAGVGVNILATGGYVGFTGIGKVASGEEGFKVNASGQTKITLDNIGDTLSVPDTIFDITLNDDSQALISSTGLIKSSSPLKITTKPDTKLIIRDIGAITAEDTALSGVCEGELLIKRIGEISSSGTAIFDVSGSDSSRSVAKLESIASISLPSGRSGVSLTSFSKIDINSIDTFEAQNLSGYAFYLTGISPSVGSIHFRDVANISLGAGNGVYAGNGSKAFIQGVASQGSIDLESSGTCLTLSEIASEISGYSFSSSGGKALDISNSITTIDSITIPENKGSVSYAASTVTHNAVVFGDPVIVTSASILDLYTTAFAMISLASGCVFKAYNSTITTLIVGLSNSLLLLNTIVTDPMTIPLTSSLLGCGVYTTAPIVEGSAIVCGNAGFDTMSGTGCAINVSNSEVGEFEPQEALRTGIRVHNDAISIWNNWGQW